MYFPGRLESKKFWIENEAGQSWPECAILWKFIVECEVFGHFYHILRDSIFIRIYVDNKWTLVW